ncbi:MAG: hypothetical protein IJS50_05385 [Desulfovibrio sp.]|nr:hypothetical protein [Desulfovibrio sp.]
MSDLDQKMSALAKLTGWQALNKPDQFGVRRVALENDLDAVFFALGGKICVMRGVVLELDKPEEKEAIYADAAQKAVAVLRMRPSILALEEAGPAQVPGASDLKFAQLICYRMVPLNVDDDTMSSEVQGWLNDLAWWKNSLSSKQSGGGESIFSLNYFQTPNFQFN